MKCADHYTVCAGCIGHSNTRGRGRGDWGGGGGETGRSDGHVHRAH